jgi:hypothetical protein
MDVGFRGLSDTDSMHAYNEWNSNAVCANSAQNMRFEVSTVVKM